MFGVSQSFLETWLPRRRTAGEMVPRPHAGGRQPRCDRVTLALGRPFVQDQPVATRAEFGTPLAPPRGVRVSGRHHVPPPPMPGAATAKKSLPATERDTPRVQQARPAYRQRSSTLELRRLQCVDEAGVKLAMTRLDGRAPQGARVIGTVPQTEGEDLTLVGAVGLQGVQAVMTVRGATEAEVFRTYVTQVLGPTLAPGEIVVLDNLAAHKAGGVQQALARRRVGGRLLPPYAPDWSPMAWWVSHLKTALRAAKARMREALETALRTARDPSTALDPQPWFKQCGSALQ